MKVTMLLADAAQSVGGKLYILGGGWTVTGPGLSSMAVAIKVEVPWDQANQPHEWRLDLIDEDGAPVLLDTPEGAKPLVVEGHFEVGRPPGLKPGTPIDWSAALNFAGLPLPPGTGASSGSWRTTQPGSSRCRATYRDTGGCA